MTYLTPNILSKIRQLPSNKLAQVPDSKFITQMNKSLMENTVPSAKSIAHTLDKNEETKMMATLMLMPEFLWFLDTQIFPKCIVEMLDENAELTSRQKYDIIRADVMKKLYWDIHTISRRKIKDVKPSRSE